MQGKVAISGRTPLDDLASYELEFSYAQDASQTWFWLAEGQQAVFDGPLAEWDTSTITDGNYNLRLTIHLKDGSSHAVVVTQLRVRNYSPVETSTPGPSATPRPASAAGTPLPTVSPAATVTARAPSATPFPTNPAELTLDQVTDSLVTAVFGAFGALALLGIYVYLRQPRRKR